jgi:hypothetical protein
MATPEQLQKIRTIVKLGSSFDMFYNNYLKQSENFKQRFEKIHRFVKVLPDIPLTDVHYMTIISLVREVSDARTKLFCETKEFSESFSVFQNDLAELTTQVSEMDLNELLIEKLVVRGKQLSVQIMIIEKMMEEISTKYIKAEKAISLKIN